MTKETKGRFRYFLKSGMVVDTNIDDMIWNNDKESGRRYCMVHKGLAYRVDNLSYRIEIKEGINLFFNEDEISTWIVG